MNLEKNLYTILNSSGYDVYADIAPQNKPKPFIVYNVIFDGKINGLQKSSKVQSLRIQVDIYATSYDERYTINENLETALEAGDLPYLIYGSKNSNLQGEGFRKTIDMKIYSNQ